MTIGNTRRKGTGGVVSTPPIPAHEALRKLEKRYAEKCAQLERAEATITVLRSKLEKQKCRTK